MLSEALSVKQRISRRGAMMKKFNQELHTELKEAEDELNRLERRVSAIVCTTVPIAIVTYTLLF
jgi:hypothetical protein